MVDDVVDDRFIMIYQEVVWCDWVGIGWERFIGEDIVKWQCQ